MSLHRQLSERTTQMALNLLPDQPADRRLPEPFYVAKCRNELLHHAKDHPELTLLLEAL
jgi:hypothetical protein